MGVLSWLMAYEKLMSALVFLISFFIVIVSIFFSTFESSLVTQSCPSYSDYKMLTSLWISTV